MGFLRNRKVVGIIVAALFMTLGTIAMGKMITNYNNLIDDGWYNADFFEIYKWDQVMMNISFIAVGVIILIMELTGQHKNQIHLAVYIGMAALITFLAIDLIRNLKSLLDLRYFKESFRTTFYYVREAGWILTALMFASILKGKAFLKDKFIFPAIVYLAGDFTYSLLWGFNVESFLRYIMFLPIYVGPILGFCYWITMYMGNDSYATNNISFTANQTDLWTNTNEPSVNPDANAQLQKYRDLLNDGIISQEEYEAKRRELLGM